MFYNANELLDIPESQATVTENCSSLRSDGRATLT